MSTTKLYDKCRDCGEKLKPPVQRPFDFCGPCGLARLTGVTTHKRLNRKKGKRRRK